ncbi:hypothetical protein predicted by Glimmer/Critica [Bdellovibrio bacteriovorus HD100]|uniref:Uncharacterized protein n=2 Tax=Bdellovibrio bacteriovorus TaxID=959 RepID=Q6MJY5_BDEBA|nr:hypothetical protein EP01_09275 [Bdellovibrio bacteriovorus]ASD63178.1 hypothetical protein B9G79_06155 [Bdellovibrio bacteriovorus]CAE80424.1 hypothetical protein predicted by Glimmer/Critica [Bdellovibrio bacteriovorus HD100]
MQAWQVLLKKSVITVEEEMFGGNNFPSAKVRKKASSKVGRRESLSIGKKQTTIDTGFEGFKTRGE